MFLPTPATSVSLADVLSELEAPSPVQKVNPHTQNLFYFPNELGAFTTSSVNYSENL
jgi:hypothetical protein